jgi:predicted metal-dependent peptidase
MEKIPSNISRIQLQLMLNQPYLASAVARLPLIPVNNPDHVPTMSTDGYHIFVNPSFCDELSEPEIMGVLAHEVMHCLLGHIDRRGDRDHNIWNKAIDHATNLFLIQMEFQLPKEGLFDRKYIGMTAEEIYEEICNGINSKPQEGEEEGSSFDEHVDENHIISQLYAGDKPSPSDLKRLRKQLVEETRSAMAEKGIGKIAGMFDDELNMSVSDDVPWQHLLARFFTGLRKNDYRTFPFNKKHLWRKIYLPSIGAPGPEHIVVAIDTSGSMGADELSKILGELNQLKSTAECRMTLIQCDAEIQDIKEYNSWEIADIDFDNYGFRGRGGTTFEPVFDWIEKEVLNLGQRPDALFYLTDGYAGYGMQEPPYQVMWILTSSSIEPEQIPFGETIRMN